LTVLWTTVALARWQFVRSGQFGRKSLSYALQRAFQRWLNTASVEKLLSASIGHDPSLRDILRLVRPTPTDNERRALFGWLAEKDSAKWLPATEADLPEQVMALAASAAGVGRGPVADLGNLSACWDLLADAAKSPAVWAAIARHGSAALRMNSTRWCVMADRQTPRATWSITRAAGRRGRDPPLAAVRTSLAAYMNVGDEVRIKAACRPPRSPRQRAEPGSVVIGLTSG
jgi:60 kDa SS-A/Ro ribonucleoprotein